MKKQNPSFEKAMNAAAIWCNAWENGELSDEVLADRIDELLESETGARGFFVISLSSDSPLMDRLPDCIVWKLRQAGEMIVDLNVKNLAMSTAMSVHHERNQNNQQKENSEKVQRRCIELLRVLNPIFVKTRIEALIKSIEGKGAYTNFLNHWSYDDEQKQKIISSINSIVDN